MKLLEGKKTYLGILVAALGVFLGESEAKEIMAGLEHVVTGAGLLLAWYGRHKAKPKA